MKMKATDLKCDKSEDQVTDLEIALKRGNDDEVELGSGAEGGELDTQDDEPKDEDESNGPEVKPEDNNNFESLDHLDLMLYRRRRIY
ncbi:hypothetical protein BASA60_000980 [Batrachochytrium salamandrivorans]|nr:hypothetical protein BASA60_000980 [Batrachochytrium salamandrivorans]